MHRKASKMMKQFREEIGHSMEYSKCAMAHKEDDPMLAKMYQSFAKDSLSHSQLLLDHVQKIGASLDQEQVEPFLREMWTCTVEQMADDVASATSYLGSL